jgi:hypothetical protein
MAALMKQSMENPDQIELEEAIGAMEMLPEVTINFEH